MDHKIAVIGLGYVGLPYVHALSENKINAKVACPLFSTHDIYQGMEEAIEWYIESISKR